MWHPSAESSRLKLVFAAEWVWKHYMARLREIQSEWASLPPEDGEYALDVESRMEAAARMRDAARKQLRKDCDNFVRGGAEGPYPIPVLRT